MWNDDEKGQRRPDIFEIATAYENGNEGDKKPRTKVVVNTNRLWYGDDSTVSAFIATAYDEQGNRVDAMNGYFLDGTAHVTNKDGSVYEGEFIGGRYEGEGKLTRADGRWEEGIFMFGSFFSGTKRDKRGNIHKIQPQDLN